MYGKLPPLPPPIPNEPPSSLRPTPPPPPPHNEPIPLSSTPASHAMLVRPPFPSSVNLSSSGVPSYQQPLQYPIPYNAQQLQYGGDYSRSFNQARFPLPQPSFVPPRPGYNPGIRPLMPPQFDQPPPRNNQLLPQLDHGNQPSPQFDHNQAPSQFDHSDQPPSLFNHNNQPPSQFDHNNQPPSQFDHNNQPPSQFDHNYQPPSLFDHSNHLSSGNQTSLRNKPPSLFDYNNQLPSGLNQNQPSHYDHNNQAALQYKQSTQLGHTAQLDHQRPSHVHTVETRRLPFYQLPSGT